MSVRNGAYEAQAEAVPGCAAAEFQSDKAIEHRLAVALRDARPAIADLEDSAAAVAYHRDDNLAVAVFESVVEQIGQSLRQQMPVAPDEDAASGIQPDPKPLLLGEGLVEFGCRGGKLAEVEPLRGIGARAGFSLGNRE